MLLLSDFISNLLTCVSFFLSLLSLSLSLVPDGPPQALTAVSNTSNSITLNWSPPLPIDINGVIDNYTIRYQILEQLGVNTVDSTINTVNTTDTMFTLTDLGNYTVYNVSVSAVTIGEGPSTSMTERTNQNGESFNSNTVL